ncbi:MAG: HAD family hydrolase [Nonlabens sp.]
MIKLIASDIDGTLLDENRSISDKTAQAFKRLDLPKVLISARMPQAMYYLQDMLEIAGSPIICYNGALVLDQEAVLYNLSIPLEEMRLLAKIAAQFNLHVSFYRREEWYVASMDQWAQREVNNTRVHPKVQKIEKTLEHFENTQEKGGAHKVMFMGDEEGMDLAFAKAEQLLAKKVHLYRSKNTYTEISPKGISKKSALELLLEKKYPAVFMKEVAAFGDNFNDTEMLESVGYGVAVENAREEVKRVARFQTGHHKKDGVAVWLNNNA